jgi:hypothetical protein
MSSNHLCTLPKEWFGIRHANVRSQPTGAVLLNEVSEKTVSCEGDSGFRPRRAAVSAAYLSGVFTIGSDVAMHFVHTNRAGRAISTSDLHFPATSIRFASTREPSAQTRGIAHQFAATADRVKYA